MENVSREQIVAIAKEYLDYPSCKYDPDVENNGANENGFTCSGFVRFVLEKAGIDIPSHIRHAREFFDYFGVAVHEDKVLPGDLVFFTRHGTRPNHIGIVISKEEYIYSPGMRVGKVQIKKLQRGYKHKIDINDPQVIYTKNPIGFKRIAFPNGNRQEVIS